jgi:hypothetical protein
MQSNLCVRKSHPVLWQDGFLIRHSGYHLLMRSISASSSGVKPVFSIDLMLSNI